MNHSNWREPIRLGRQPTDFPTTQKPQQTRGEVTIFGLFARQRLGWSPEKVSAALGSTEVCSPWRLPRVCCVHQKLNGTESQRTPFWKLRKLLWDTQVFSGSVQWILLEISWIVLTLVDWSRKLSSSETKCQTVWRCDYGWIHAYFGFQECPLWRLLGIDWSPVTESFQVVLGEPLHDNEVNSEAAISINTLCMYICNILHSISCHVVFYCIILGEFLGMDPNGLFSASRK